MKEVALTASSEPIDTASLRACIATVLELPLERVLQPDADELGPSVGSMSRWLGRYGLGIARLADPAAFGWPGPWIARVEPPAGGPRFVVMFGVPSGVVWDPAAGGGVDPGWISEGYLIAPADAARALRDTSQVILGEGRVEAIYVAAAAGQPARRLEAAHALAGQGLEEDRHVLGTGTFPSGIPGSALTLIEGEVCESFDPPLGPDEHRRNVVTRGVSLNELVGRAFTIGGVRVRGMRLCEPCTVIEGYASRPVLRQLVHRGGLRADILDDGEIRVGDDLVVAVDGADRSV
ncbi:MAG: hypothetical protein P8Z81_12585 [Deinococcales bacterium]